MMQTSEEKDQDGTKDEKVVSSCVCMCENRKDSCEIGVK